MRADGVLREEGSRARNCHRNTPWKMSGCLAPGDSSENKPWRQSCIDLTVSSRAASCFFLNISTQCIVIFSVYGYGMLSFCACLAFKEAL